MNLHRKILDPDQRDRQRDQCIDELGVRSNDTGDGQCQRQAVAQRETGDYEDQILEPARDQDKSQQETHMIDACEDVHDAHLHEGKQTRPFDHTALRFAHVDRLCIGSYDVLGEVAFDGLDLRHVHMGRDKFEEGGAPQNDAIGRSAGEQELDSSVACRGGDGAGFSRKYTGPASGRCADLRFQISDQLRIIGRSAIGGQSTRFDI